MTTTLGSIFEGHDEAQLEGSGPGTYINIIRRLIRISKHLLTANLSKHWPSRQI